MTTLRRTASGFIPAYCQRLLMFAGLVTLSVSATAAGPPMDTEALAQHLTDVLLQVDIEYAPSPGPASSLLAGNQVCGQCHTTGTTEGVDQTANSLLLIRPGLSPASGEDNLRQQIQAAEDTAAKAPQLQTAGVLLGDGRTVIAGDSLTNTIRRTTARHLRHGSLSLSPVARIPSAGLAAFRLEHPLPGRLETAESDARLGSPVLVGWLPERAAGPEVTLTIVAAARQLAGDGLPQQKLDIRGTMIPAGAPVLDADGRLSGLVVANDDGADVCMQPASVLQKIMAGIPQGARDTPAQITIPIPWAGMGLAESDGRVTVTEVLEESPAAAAGLSDGDVILKSDGLPLTSTVQLVAQIRSLDVGTRMTLLCERDGKEITVDLTLGERPRATPPATQATTGCPAMHHWQMLYSFPPGVTPDASHHLNLNSFLIAPSAKPVPPGAVARPLDVDGDGYLDLMFNSQLLQNGVTVVPSAPDSQRLEELASQLDELADSLQKLSEEVRALRDEP